MTASTLRQRCAQLRREISTPDELGMIVEAHDGVSAMLVERAGFRAVWASSLTISTAWGVRDCNELSWTQFLCAVEQMSDAISIPILADGDTGHGNFNNTRRFVRKLCERGVAGVCIEDKLYPKMNSFIGAEQPLAEIGEFTGKLKAAKDAQLDEQFCLVARTEAFISGQGLGEALRRAHAYQAAGADALVVHSKKSTAQEIVAFMREWKGGIPVIVIPTTYHGVTAAELEAIGVAAVVFPNQTLRAAVPAMRATLAKLYATRTLGAVEQEVEKLSDLFALLDYGELEAAERRYLPAPAARAIVVTAPRRTSPEHRATIGRQRESLLQAGVRDVTVVDAGEGFKAALAAALSAPGSPALMIFDDVLVHRSLVRELLQQTDDVLAVQLGDLLPQGARENRPRYLVELAGAWCGGLVDEDTVRIVGIAEDPPRRHGEWIGVARLSHATGAELASALSAPDVPGDVAGVVAALDRVSNGPRGLRACSVGARWMSDESYLQAQVAREGQGRP